ncbi:WD repeat-containing protein 75 [Eutrema salsugineum]|uniref:WD repeat-containing protein 75 n=1 Tax=Eutrema salsugineum TaxID=72664 RepID=UPI000CED6E5B|nr:WD repeat-containing protein 75 [Eutrema salsugineum]
MSPRKMIRGGRNYITSVPAFSNDAKKLLLCTANSVSVFSVATGLQITSLEGHTAPVTTVIVDSACDETSTYCWTASLDGKIRSWEFSTPKLLRTFHTHLPIYSLVMIPFHLSRELIFYVSVEDCSSVSRDLFGQIRRYNLSSEESLLSGDTLKEMEEPKPIVMSPSGEFFGVCHNCKIHIWNATLGETEHVMAKEMTLHHTELITVFAFHPNKRMLAAGDATGRVLIWKEIGNADESCTTFNWHSTEVTVVNFSSDGAFLYSGGKEGVLVVWELDTGKKQLLPKIESPLLFFIFSSDPTLSSAICADNQIHLLKMPSMEILRTISGIKPRASEPMMFTCDDRSMHIRLIRTVSIDRSSGIAAFSTANHRVQLYNLLNDHEISEVQVCERNHQPDADGVRVLVTAVALSRNGSVMATAEARFAAGSLSRGLVTLKFWVFVPDNKTFSLSTVISQPHREAAITAIVLNPARSMAVSISSAGDFKIWVCNSDKNLTPEDSNWICHGVGSYKKKPITAAAFSGDGSCLALAATTVLTIWNPLQNKLLYVFGKSHTPITAISFAGGFLVAASHFPDSNPHLSVWDLMTFGLSWSYRLSIEAIATQSEMLSPYFAVLAEFLGSHRSAKSNEQIFRGKDGAILLFDGSGPKPVAIWTVMKAHGGSLSFVEDSKKSQTLLAYVNGRHEYVLFDPFSDETLETSAKDYEVLLAAISEKSKRSRKKTLLAMLERPFETMFCGSTLNIPPFPDVCADFFASRMRKNICESVEMQPESHSP